MSPHVPRVGSFPSGITPGFGTPVPSKEWTFTWAGYMSISLQASTDTRESPNEAQSATVFHSPPETIDSYGDFTSTNSVPGNWVSMRFAYGNQHVTANVSLETWNPSRPSTYYQLGSQYFINNVFLSYRPDPFYGFRLQATVGYFSNSYGGLGQYGGGLYVNNIAGGPRGAGETILLERQLNETYSVAVEHGIMGDRTGKVPDDVVPQQNNGYKNPIWPADWTHHLHLGVTRKGDPELRAQAHYLTNWSQDDRTRLDLDNPDTEQVDESNPPDGRITVYSVGASLKDSVYGFLGAGAALIDARNAYTLRGLQTYGNEGEHLTDRFFGATSQGTGKLYVAGINFTVSLGKNVAHPGAFNGEGPGVWMTTAFRIVTSDSPCEAVDG
jgi:hypothetical protein